MYPQLDCFLATLRANPDELFSNHVRRGFHYCRDITRFCDGSIYLVEMNEKAEDLKRNRL
jgi:hypothetical protein